MDFAGLLKTAWERFISDIIQLVLFTLLGSVLCITIVLIPTVMGGWCRGILRLTRDGTKPDFSELWNFDDYLQIALLLLVQAVLIAIGYMLLVVPGAILSTWWLYSLFFLVDRDMGFLEALGASKDAVSEGGFLNHLVAMLIVAVLAALGSSLSGFGALFTTPFSLILLATIYRELPGSHRGR